MTSEPDPAAAWDAEYAAGRYASGQPVPFTCDIVSAARQAGATHGLYIAGVNLQRVAACSVGGVSAE
jgi:hypothetical protein